MDPDEALRLIRADIAKFEAPDLNEWPSVTDLIEHFEALDQWLSGGGYLPTAWHLAASGRMKAGIEQAGQKYTTKKDTVDGLTRITYYKESTNDD